MFNTDWLFGQKPEKPKTLADEAFDLARQWAELAARMRRLWPDNDDKKA